MSAVADTARILRYSARSAFEDFRREYTIGSWVGEWGVRITFQVIFFGLIGKLLGSTEQLHFLLIGNAIMLASMTVMFVVQTTVWERWTGTLPLLIASPASPIIVFMGRSVEWIPDAVISSLLGLIVVGAVFGLPLPWPEIGLMVPLILLVTLSTYMMGAFLGSLVLRSMNSRNLVANLSHGIMMAVCGVNVPVTFFPEWVQRIAAVLPLTHGLKAARAVLGGGSSSYVWTNIRMEVMVGAGWLILALASFRLARRRGTTRRFHRIRFLGRRDSQILEDPALRPSADGRRGCSASRDAAFVLSASRQPSTDFFGIRSTGGVSSPNLVWSRIPPSPLENSTIDRLCREGCRGRRQPQSKRGKPLHGRFTGRFRPVRVDVLEPMGLRTSR